MDYIKIWVVIICLAVTLSPAVQGEGTIEVRFDSYDNPGGLGDNGNECDGWGMFSARSECDSYFEICLDWPENMSDSMDDCLVGKTRTGKVHNQDSFDFTDYIGETPNPLIFPFTTWSSESILKVKVDVTDEDTSNDDDHIELLPPVLVNIIPAANVRDAEALTVIASQRTTLILEIKAYCGDSWYGPQCDVWCVPQDNVDRHYSCGPNGERICLTGWQGINCNIPDNCAASPCKNGATCTSTPHGYTCQCTSQFIGFNCEEEYQLQTIEFANLVREATTTADPDNLCRPDPCLNGGTCYEGRSDGEGAYYCICLVTFTGTHCETGLCESGSCHHGSCVNASSSGSVCECENGWTGLMCNEDENECEVDVPCYNNATCLNTLGSFECQCSSGWSGEHCSTSLSPCLPVNPCQNEGVCEQTDGGFMCNCDSRYSGDLCQINAAATRDEGSGWTTAHSIALGVVLAVMAALFLGLFVWYLWNRSHTTKSYLSNVSVVPADPILLDLGRVPSNFRCHSDDCPGTKMGMDDNGQGDFTASNDSLDAYK